MTAIDRSPFEPLRRSAAVQPLRVLGAEELYELARIAMADRSLYHPGRCRRPPSAVLGQAPGLPRVDERAEDIRCPAEQRYNRCNLRCDMSYWHAHGSAVGSLMASLARRLGKDPNLYMATGVLSTIDYLAHPHDLGGEAAAGDDGVHPGPLVRRLMELEAPRSMLLAILEAPPHTGLPLSGLLSHALRVCDSMVACLEAEREFPLPDGAAELRELLGQRDTLRLLRHGEFELVERESVLRHTRESCLVLALAVRTKDAKRAERKASREDVRQGLAEALAQREREEQRRRPGRRRADSREGEASGGR